MKTINIYFQAVTKVTMSHLEIEDDDNIESHIETWIAQGYVKTYFASNKVSDLYVPWQNVIYIQCSNV